MSSVTSDESWLKCRGSSSSRYGRPVTAGSQAAATPRPGRYSGRDFLSPDYGRPQAADLGMPDPGPLPLAVCGTSIVCRATRVDMLFLAVPTTQARTRCPAHSHPVRVQGPGVGTARLLLLPLHLVVMHVPCESL